MKEVFSAKSTGNVSAILCAATFLFVSVAIALIYVVSTETVVLAYTTILCFGFVLAGLPAHSHEQEAHGHTPALAPIPTATARPARRSPSWPDRTGFRGN